MSQAKEYDTAVLHQARARLRREMLVDGPFTELLLVRHAQQSFTDEDLEADGAAGSRLSETGEAAHASITRVRFDDGHWAVQTVNEIDHLRRHKLVTY